MKTIVIYNSKTGFSQKYASWIAEELNCKCVCSKDAEGMKTDAYDTIVFGGGIYAGNINGISWVKGQLKEGSKRLAVFATGATPEDSVEEKRVLDQNFSEEEKARVKFFYFQGGLNYERMSIPSRIMMSIFCKMLKRKKDKTKEEQGMGEAISQSFDCTDKKQIQPIISWVKSNV